MKLGHIAACMVVGLFLTAGPGFCADHSQVKKVGMDESSRRRFATIWACLWTLGYEKSLFHSPVHQEKPAFVFSAIR